ncbi:MAG: hypothetical protein JWM85_2310 [Acidimicrobiaceae bacterium]|nr:hypothetical protein [Acidimicrobiaceae bacterium]
MIRPIVGLALLGFVVASPVAGATSGPAAAHQYLADSAPVNRATAVLAGHLTAAEHEALVGKLRLSALATESHVLSAYAATVHAYQRRLLSQRWPAGTQAAVQYLANFAATVASDAQRKATSHSFLSNWEPRLLNDVSAMSAQSNIVSAELGVG